MSRPPLAPRRDHLHRRHGVEVVDPYHWLRDEPRSDPAVLDYLNQENEHTDAVMAPNRELQQRLYREMVSRIQETDQSVPYRFGSHLYYSRTQKGLQYRSHFRRAAVGDGAPEQLLLDENELARDLAYFRLGAFEVSPDGTLLAYATDNDGSERLTIRVKELTTGALLPDTIPNASYGLEWDADSRTLFYTTLDAAHRPFRLLRHRLDSDPGEDVVVHEETDDAFFVGIHKTNSKRFLVLSLESNSTHEVRLAEAADPLAPFRVVHPRQARMEYGVEHHGDDLLILTNEDAVNFKLMRAPVDDPSHANWEELLPHREEVKLEGLELFAGHAAIVERERGIRGLTVMELPAWSAHRIDFPEPAYTAYLVDNYEFDTRQLRLLYTSLVTPSSIFDYDMQTRERVLRKRQPVLGEFDAGAYRTDRLYAAAADGTAVPISVVWREDQRRPTGNPTLLYGYGAYGASIDPTFDSARISLLDRGFVYAIAHVRGGGDLGRPWYEDGKLLRKRNSFGDFIACAEHLIEHGYSSAERLAIRGGSAGGLLVGAVTNMRPELFRAVVAKVPFVDVVNTMLDRSLPLTVTEWEEWGNPESPEVYEYLRSYSPYDNVVAEAYPAMLVTAGLNDPRVQYWEPAKWVAKLRATKTDDRVLLLKTEMGAGHSGPSGRYEHLEELAFEFAFLLRQVAGD